MNTYIKKEKGYKYEFLLNRPEFHFPIIHKMEQVIHNRHLLFQLKIIFSKELQYVINKFDVKKCGIMLALFIVVLIVASQFMQDEDGSNENITVALEPQKRNKIRP